MTPISDIIDHAMQWVQADPDPETQRELLDLTSRAEGDEAAAAQLRDRFSGHLQFGTAGLRAALGAGPMRMNRARDCCWGAVRHRRLPSRQQRIDPRPRYPRIFSTILEAQNDEFPDPIPPT